MPSISEVKYGALTPLSGAQKLYLHASWNDGVTGVDFSTGPVTFPGSNFVDTGSANDLINGEIVRFTTTGTLPTGLALATNYFVRDAATPQFKVAATAGGAAVTITGGGSGTHTVERWEGSTTQWEVETSQDGVAWDPAAFSLSREVFLPELTVAPDLAFRVRTAAPGVGPWSSPYTVEFPVIVGPAVVNCLVGARPPGRMLRTAGAASSPGSWTLSGVPGVGIHSDGEPIEGLLGGGFSGAPSEDGEFNALVTFQALVSEGNEWFDSKHVLFRVDGSRYIADFHSDRSRVGVLVDIHTGAADGWQFESGALPVIFGDGFTLHAVLRDGLAYVPSGVTDLALVCKLRDQRDAPHTFSFTDATPSVDTFGAVKAWPLTVDFRGTMLEACFAVLNAPEVAAEASRALVLDAQISWTHGGRRRASRVFALSVQQPLILR